MGFKIPNYLKKYLENAKWRKPFESFVNNSTYYAQLNWQWLSYMETVVRPCIAYSTASVDGSYNNTLSVSTGMSLLRGATRLIAGDKYFFTGNDEASKFLSDIWAPATNFNRFKNRAISFMLSGGTSVIKFNTDEVGRCSLTAFRVDRTIFTTSEEGEITNAVFFIGVLSRMRNDGEQTYWLVEERKYNQAGQKTLIYKVFTRSGTVTSPTLPSPFQRGVNFENLPRDVREQLHKMRVFKLNEEIPLNTIDGLGVWLLSRTSVNSCVPDSPLGDPLLYGCLDILWSIDLVFSGSIIDVLNGEGKIIVPKQFLQDTLNRLQKQYPEGQFNVTTMELDGYKDESFVYIMPSGLDKDKIAPLPVQFDIRAEQYGKMLEIYERLAAVRAGFSPTSIFPYLTPDNSAKTATEITAEENLTRASVLDAHSLIVPVLDRALREVCLHEGYEPDVHIQLSDYIGNKIQYDQNIRDNLSAGIVPLEIAVKQVNNLNDSETQEYLDKIENDKSKEYQRQTQAYGNSLFNEKDYFGETDDGGSE